VVGDCGILIPGAGWSVRRSYTLARDRERIGLLVRSRSCVGLPYMRTHKQKEVGNANYKSRRGARLGVSRL